MKQTVRHLIAGVWKEPVGDRSRTSASPLGEQYGSCMVVDATPTEIDRMLVHSAEAQAVWYETMTVKDRSAALLAAAQALSAAADRVAEVMTREIGKTLPESLGEIANAMRLLEFYSGAVLRPQGRTFSRQREDTVVYTSREPLGTILGIAPWNFPVNLSIMKMAAAFAAGNAFVLKPSHQAAATTEEFIGAMKACFPDGLISVVQGGADVVRQLIDDARVAAVTFTGSTGVGRAVIAQSGARGIPCLAEMGGNNAIVLTANGDADRALSAALDGAFRMAGQKCTASGLLFVEESRLEEVRARVADSSAELAQRYRIGDPLADGTVIGSMVSVDDAARVQRLTTSAVEKGATRIPLGTGEADGAFLEPVVLFDVTEDMEVFSEEVFGPVLSIVPYQCIDDVIRVLNGLNHGLVSAIYSESLAEVFEFSKRVRTGTVLANQPTTGLDFNIPFQGWNQSGFGDAEQSDESLQFYSRSKTLYVSW